MPAIADATAPMLRLDADVVRRPIIAFQWQVEVWVYFSICGACDTLCADKCVFVLVFDPIEMKHSPI